MRTYRVSGRSLFDGEPWSTEIRADHYDIVGGALVFENWNDELVEAIAPHAWDYLHPVGDEVTR